MSSQVVKGGAVWNVRSPGWGYGVAIGATILAGLMRWAMQPVLGAEMPHVTFYVAVSIAAWYGGLGPALLALALGALSADFFFVQPIFQFTIYHLSSVVDVSLFFFVGLTISLLSEMLHRERLRVQETCDALTQTTRTAAEILTSMTEAYFSVDRDWKLIEVNQRLGEHLGRDANAMLGKSLWDTLPALEKSIIGQRYRRAMAEQKIDSFEVESVVHPGRWLWIHVYPKPDRLYVYLRDITDRKAAEAALRDSEERFRVMAETVPEILFTNRPDGANDYVSHRFYEYTGVKEAQGDAWAKALHPDDRHRVFEQWRHSVTTGEPFEIEFRLRSAAGNYRWFLTRSRPIRDAQGQIIKWFGASTDIDVWKRTEAELKIAKDEAERASRAKDAFLAALSHELRTPLTPVLMTLTAMESDENGVPSKLSGDLAMMRRNVELETKLIDDLIDLTRISRGKIQLHLHPIDVHETIKEAIETCCRSDVNERKLHLNIALDAVEHHAWADWARLQQVMWNVLKNAIKFTPEQGLISVATRNEKPDWLTIDVKDSGVGIEPHALPRIFNAFEQEDVSVTRQFGGLGLGLAISKTICDMHGGSIAAQSEGKGKGATFTIRLPTIKVSTPGRDRPEKPEVDVAAALTQAQSRQQRLRILLVEDHESTARVMAKLLERMEHQVKVAGDVQSALQLAGSESFDLIVSDLGLPDGSGHELMGQLREQYKIPGICLSGYGMEEDVRKSLEAGFAEHLTKPLNFDQFRAAVNRVVARR